MTVKIFVAALALGILGLCAGANAAPRSDPFAPYGIATGSPFIRVPDPPKVAPHKWRPVTIMTTGGTIRPVADPKPNVSPASVPAPPAVSTKQWSVIGLMQGPYPAAILSSGSDTVIVQLGDQLPDGSGKVTAMDTNSVTVRSRLTRADIQITMGGTGNIPVN